ncbi:hypothetical protein HG535_0E05790 [Zygotorulaspora mrakii]|uniref:UDP-N-acetylglucosamine transferase subunit ALG13 n=1 Tax=Zygotorulaspora mrakii TaxID=42260 RepID=A0A7H9B489_ZYGMR|nr:uncharacterized protein HG535_0E05790 [Zygotorulaspora mrakii]QLG73495.1 hypothetical protein HG535_0E05790 [Zygotorulaspora mrakii]
MKTLLVTCGATVSFPKLICSVISAPFIGELKSDGFERLIVQFGKDYREEFAGKLDNELFIEVECSISTAELGTVNTPVSRTLMASHFEIIGIDFSSKIQHVIKEHADLVISHAGTGSILDSLRLAKPLIICVNDDLMNNHQQQIADKFESYGYVWACSAKPKDLLRCLTRSRSEVLKPFQATRSDAFEGRLKFLAFS